jgi:uncharacterized tellurite resistance protein B-like protein
VSADSIPAPLPTLDDLDHALLLAAHMIVADGEIGHDELQLFQRAMTKAQASEATRLSARRVFSDDPDQVSFAHALAAVPRGAREVVYRLLAAIAWADGVVVASEQAMLDEAARVWGLSERTVAHQREAGERRAKEMEAPRHTLDTRDRTRSAAARWLAAFDGVLGSDTVDKMGRWIPHRETQEAMQAARRELLLIGEGYDEAVRRCAVVAAVDYEVAAPALRASGAALDELRSRLAGRVAALDGGGKGPKKASAEVREALDALHGRLTAHLLPRMERLQTGLRQRHRALRDFTVAILGRTKAGKSTLHAVLTGEGWDDIGVGSLRTTRFRKSYCLDGLRIVDTPGIGAPGGQSDVEIAESVVDEADVIVFLVTDDSTQAVELAFLEVLREAWKPLVVLLNVKRGLDRPAHVERFLRNPEWVFRERDLAGHEERLRRHVREHFGNDYFSVVPVHLEAARKARMNEQDPRSAALLEASRLHRFLDHVRVDVLRDGVLRRSQTLLGASARDLFVLAAELQAERDALTGLCARLKQTAAGLRVQLQQARQDAVTVASQRLSALWSELDNEIDGFAEQHWNDDERALEAAWKALLADLGFEARSDEALALAQEAYQQRARVLIAEAAEELRLTVAFDAGGIRAKGAGWGWADFARKWTGKVLMVAGSIALYWTPWGWAALGLGALVTLFNFFFKSREERRREAVARIAEQLRASAAEGRSKHIAGLTEALGRACDVLVDKVVGDLELLARSAEVVTEDIDATLVRVEDQRMALDLAFAARILAWSEDRDVGDAPPHDVRLTGVHRGARSLQLYVREAPSVGARAASLEDVLQVDVTWTVAGW